MPEKPTVGDRPYFIDQPEFYDGEYQHHQSADVFLNLEAQLSDLHSSEIDLSWATRRIKQGLLDWVAASVLIKRVLRLRLYQDKFSDWKDYCIKALGKRAAAIKIMIDRADVVIELAKAGFTVLPVNQSQVGELIRCCHKMDCLIYEAWEKVVSSLPEPLITGDAIAEVLGFAAKKERITINREVGDRLRKEAVSRGISSSELHQQIIDDWLAEQDETEDTDRIESDKLEAWERDVKELVIEHDNQNWLWCVVLKLSNLVRSKSNFSWLADYRVECQT